MHDTRIPYFVMDSERFRTGILFCPETLPLVSETLELEMVEHLVGVRNHDR